MNFVNKSYSYLTEIEISKTNVIYFAYSLFLPFKLVKE